MAGREAVCQGCGSVFQSEHPDEPGYVPQHVLERGQTDLRCRRCFRLEHYGVKQAENRRTVPSASLAPPDAPGEVERAVADADAVVMVVDLWDFEGSFLPDLVAPARGPVIMVVNKVDLLPTRTPRHEVIAWVHDRARSAGVNAAEVRLISAERGTGVKALRKFFESEIGPRSRIALVGAVNVGKSALIRALLPKGSSGPTTSTLPATTQHVVSHSLGRDGLTILDTPGVIPGHRIPDLLCPQCAAALVPRKRLRSKLVHMGGGKGVLFGGLAAVRCDDESLPQIVTLAFTSENVPLHYTRAARVIELLQGEGKHWLHTDCPACRSRLEEGGWEDVQYTVSEMEELAIPGLGWVSPRGGELHVTVTVPAGALVKLRPRLIGSKTPSRSAAPRKRTGFKSKR